MRSPVFGTRSLAFALISFLVAFHVARLVALLVVFLVAFLRPVAFAAWRLLSCIHSSVFGTRSLALTLIVLIVLQSLYCDRPTAIVMIVMRSCCDLAAILLRSLSCDRPSMVVLVM